MNLDAFFLSYFGKEKCDSFTKFCVEKSLSGQDLYEAAKSTKWKIDQGNITSEGATAYMWKILWNKFRAQLGGTAYVAPEEPKDLKVDWGKAKESLKELSDTEKRIWPRPAGTGLQDDGSYIEPVTKQRRPYRAPVFYPRVNKPEEPLKPTKKRRINFDEE